MKDALTYYRVLFILVFEMFVNINRVIELNAIVYAAIQWCMLGRSKQIKANNNVTQPKEMYWICQIFHHKVSTNAYDCL